MHILRKAKKEINHQEIIAHGSLKHKNIPQIYGYYKNNFFFMF